ncbi:MAG: dihydroxyacetone kinase subunit L [Gemmatimonadaceae bacterium]|nr:dihydroxyacetone kinase subunit L [Gemmatimonadaceae bacterium]
MLTTAAIIEGVVRMQAHHAAIRDALNEADRALGDGDTGMTVATIIGACDGVAAQLPADLGAALAELGRAASRASGSSLGAVLAMGLSAAGRTARGKDSAICADVCAMLDAATRVITERSGATPGDKTVLDSFLHIQQALASCVTHAPMLPPAITAARAALDLFRPRESRLGRARMYGSRSIGLDDPGMLAVALLLEAVAVDR